MYAMCVMHRLIFNVYYYIQTIGINHYQNFSAVSLDNGHYTEPHDLKK